MPNTATLSVTRTFMSAPSRDLIDSMGPSTASMVPRIRTVGGCCAHAAVPSRVTKVSEAANRRGHEEDFSMVFLPRCIGAQLNANTARGYLFRRGAITLAVSVRPGQ